MTRNIRFISMVGAIAATVLTGSALADAGERTALLGGPASPEDPVNKVVAINAGTRWANVNQGETVKFIVGDKSFAWHFETPKLAVNLAEIAPAGTIDRTIYVYVAPNHESDE